MRRLCLCLCLLGCAPATGPDTARDAPAPAPADPGWRRGDRAIVLPIYRDPEMGLLPVTVAEPGGRFAWVIASGTEVIVLEDAPPGSESVEVMVPAAAISSAGNLADPPRPSGEPITLPAAALNRPR
jgi:hypothetical protein